MFSMALITSLFSGLHAGVWRTAYWSSHRISPAHETRSEHGLTTDGLSSRWALKRETLFLCHVMCKYDGWKLAVRWLVDLKRNTVIFLVHPESRLSQPNTVPVQPEPTQVSDHTRNTDSVATSLQFNKNIFNLYSLFFRSPSSPQHHLLCIRPHTRQILDPQQNPSTQSR